MTDAMQMDRETAERMYRKVVEYADAYGCSITEALYQAADLDDANDLRRYMRDQYGIYA